MTAQSDTFGLVYLEYSDPERHIPWKIPAGDKSLAASLVRESALALANIKLQETLRNRSIRDSLTGLFNRRFLEEALARELARCQRNPAPLAVIMLDVDHFKRFNDAHGHDAGDLVLRELGGMLTEESRGGDIACRFGGEEFTVLLPDTPIAAATEVAERLRQAASRMQVKRGNDSLGPVTLSLGVAAHPDHGSTVEELLRAADSALYRAKREGRNRVCVARAADASTAQA